MFVSIGVWKEGQQTAATVIIIVGDDEDAAHRNVAGFFCPLLCLPASNYYSCAAADSCDVYTVWGLLSNFEPALDMKVLHASLLSHG